MEADMFVNKVRCLKLCRLAGELVLKCVCH